MAYAPIALFTYNRADRTQQAVDSLLKNAEAKDSDLFIFSDGPKNEKAVEGVKKNREYIHTVQGFKSVTIIEREKNWGLANSLIAGITEVINQYEKIIVIEDDLILSPYFLKFLNEGLEEYKDDDRVGAICGYQFQLCREFSSNFFLYFMHPWGWATWKRSWVLFNPNTNELLRRLRFKTKKFNLGGNCGSYDNLYCQKVGLIDSWYIRYYASIFLANKLILYPGKSLVSNSGMDGSGTHCGEELKSVNNFTIYTSPIGVDKINVEESAEAYQAYKDYFDKTRNEEENNIKFYYHRFKSFVRRLLYIDCI